jgi:predicted amidohydrolase
MSFVSNSVRKWPTCAGRLGVSICYDLRFPEMYLELVNRGAEVILVPAAFTVPTGTAHWHTLLRGKIFSHNEIIWSNNSRV